MSSTAVLAAAAAASESAHAAPLPAAAAIIPPINVNSTHTAAGAGRSWLRQTRSSARAGLDSNGDPLPLGASDAPLFYSLLVHNLSHSDLMLGIRTPDGTVNVGTPTGATADLASSTASAELGTSVPPLPPSIVARPKFSRFKQISQRLLGYVDGAGGGPGALQGIEFPSPLRAQQLGQQQAGVMTAVARTSSQAAAPAASSSSSSAAAAAAAASTTSPLASPASSAKSATCPYGFRVKDGCCRFADWTSFKLKGEDGAWGASLAKACPKPEIIGVFFPMLAVLVPRWLSIVAGKNARRGILHGDQNKKVLFLISGAGTPWNTEHDASGNSTKGVAKLATLFLNQFYPDVEVHTLHSGVEIFHYDANVQFVNKELKPRIEEVRRILADKYADKWSKFMHLATTLTDGASARISAINASLRHLRPDCLHMWQLKSFWHEYPLVSGARGEADVEFHEFDKLEMTPPTLVSETDNWVRMLVKEMIAHKEEFERVRDGDREKVPNELDSFWLRKSKQPVLSVLMVKKKNKGVRFFRGINVEDLRMIAVLALGLEPHSTTSALSTNMAGHIPRELIPLAPTTAYGTHASPTRGPISPRINRYPSLSGSNFQAAQAAAAAALAAQAQGGEVSIDTSAADASMQDADDGQLPQSAGRPAMHRTTSERSIFGGGGSRKNSTSGASGTAPPTSPALKGKTGSPRALTAAGASPAKQAPPPLEEDLATAATGSSSVTPRKRKGSTAGRQSPLVSAQPSPVGVGVGTGSVTFGSPTMSSSTPPIHSPRFTRNHTTPAGAAAGAAAAGGSPPQVSAVRDISAQLSRSAHASNHLSPQPPAVSSSSASSALSPLSPLRSMQTRGSSSNGAAAANVKDAADDAGGRDKKRPRRSPSVPRVSATSSSSSSAAAAASSTDPALVSIPQASVTPPSHASDSQFASGVVDESMRREYLAHELSLVAHREALHLPPEQVARLSGNLAPNATTPVERGERGSLSEDPLLQSALVHSQSLGSHAGGAGGAGAHGHVLDERNPINPCGSCNEWLKKIAEVNPEFKVITFTSTDCSTCFVKAVKF